MKKILIHTRQAGSASALIPVANQLKENGCSVFVLCEGVSTDLWKLSGVKFKEVNSFEQDIINEYSPDFILTGTSLKVEEDSKYWNWSHINSIPSLAYVESWVNYKQRFSVVNNFDSLPSIIGVADELIQKRLEEEGVKKDIIKVLYQPRFDNLIKDYYIGKKKTSKKEAIISIFTNPLYIGKENIIENERYNSEDILMEIISSLEKINAENTINSKIYIKIHPRETKENYSKINFKYLENTKLNIEFVNSDSTDLIFNSKIVIGFNSIVLLDSSILKIPTIGYQPNKLMGVCDITHNRSNLKVIKDVIKLEFFLKKLIKSKKVEDNIEIQKINSSIIFSNYITSKII